MKPTRNHNWDCCWAEFKSPGADPLSPIIFQEMRKAVDFRGKSILELGCGTGRLSQLALEAGAVSATLVDSSPKALSMARQLFGEAVEVEFIEADFRELRLEKKYDIVFSSGVLEHFSSAERPEIVNLHRRFSRRTVMILVPAGPHYNNLRMRLTKTIRLYGWQRPLSRRNMRQLFLETGIAVRVNRRFHPLYAVPRIERFDCLGKILRPLESALGGLLITAGEIDGSR